ncbi:Uncharacterised protein [Mycoplasmopsis californica]|uniref:Lipoprotein n=1 Tax=Mycoplasmopsis equigenitalium TaxID=114883 RepID=A0ABY5J0K4_9BACT|nr:hypothetical protein [Mycoplasmopsis equigenitalium]UUD36792.1 hypothetical protein NPA09_02745 [Mycoplasmopsis equigenitalium]VEU69910.1 Uncharacterised protein [Mycoplasmopsis californica]
MKKITFLIPLTITTIPLCVTSCGFLGGEVPKHEWTRKEVEPVITKYKDPVKNLSVKNIVLESLKVAWKESYSKERIKNLIISEFEDVNKLLATEKDQDKLNESFLKIFNRYLRISLTATWLHQGWESDGKSNDIHREITNDIFQEQRYINSFKFFITETNGKFIRFEDNKLIFNFTIASLIADGDTTLPFKEPLYFYNGPLEMEMW